MMMVNSVDICYSAEGKSGWTQTEQDRPCTYNVTLRRIRATVVGEEKQ